MTTCRQLMTIKRGRPVFSRKESPSRLSNPKLVGQLLMENMINTEQTERFLSVFTSVYMYVCNSGRREVINLRVRGRDVRGAGEGGPWDGNHLSTVLMYKIPKNHHHHQQTPP